MACIVLLAALLCANLLPAPAAAEDVFRRYDKVIWIDQAHQYGAAYRHGEKLAEFPIMTGDDETPTPPGVYVIKKKEVYHYSRKYQTPMPYSLFFDYQGRAIHEGWVADTEEMSDWATHGCIHVEQPYMKWLFDWAEAGKTVVVIQGHRVWNLDKKSEKRKELEEEQQQQQDREEESAPPPEYEEKEGNDLPDDDIFIIN